MTRNYAKSCRICLAEGSRDIFSSMSPAGLRSDASVSSVSRLLEKLRFVTMMQISENDNLPPLICDSCIVELNVAYNFKRQAIDTSIYLQRHTIELGGRTQEECIETSPPRIFKETPLEVKEELLEPQIQTQIFTTVVAADAGSPSTSVASGSSRSMVQVNTSSFPNIGADSTSDKDFVESYLPPKKRGREFQVHMLTPTPSTDEPAAKSTATSIDHHHPKSSRVRTHNTAKQITLRPRSSAPNYSEKRVKVYQYTQPKKKASKSAKSTPVSGKNTRHRRFKNATLTAPSGQSINPVAMVKTMLRSRRTRLTIS
ncbi:uncharacterized protein LOC132264107 [Phlebotomus argentipes]|uniref:uncharacterized protein LOC132264107 n=1 Tax=Phlebotomus argentipes TaxID=94469 RepID=UPI0028929FFB|nr:uncharacterized protein LOC132264107 [Phlebotomus argentipes]